MTKAKKVEIYFVSNNDPLWLLLTEFEIETLIEFMKGTCGEFDFIDHNHNRHILNRGFISHIKIVEGY